MAIHQSPHEIILDADVLVLGGGPAGTWAAYTAAKNGARVVLADKGFCGTSGATAPSGTNLLNLPTNPEERLLAIDLRRRLGGNLSDADWVERTLQQTFVNMHKLAGIGYPFALDEQGLPYRGGLQGPEYMGFMRRLIVRSQVTILDYSPALELLGDSHGVAGAAGIQQKTGQPWRVNASAVVIATGGAAFLSKSLGTNQLTGEGYLMAVEAGAHLSGMEFSSAYAISPIFSSMTKTAFYYWASY